MSDHVIVEGQNVTVRTEDLRTVVDCSKPHLVAAIIRVMHDTILVARTAAAREVTDGVQLKKDLAAERDRTLRREAIQETERTYC